MESFNNESKKNLTPPVKDGFVRLYRGETDVPNLTPIPDWVLESPEFKSRPSGSFFTESYDDAVWYNQQEGIDDGNINYIDIPIDELENYRSSNNRGREFSARGKAEEEFFLPTEIASQKSKFIK